MPDHRQKISKRSGAQRNGKSDACFCLTPHERFPCGRFSSQSTQQQYGTKHESIQRQWNDQKPRDAKPGLNAPECSESPPYPSKAALSVFGRFQPEIDASHIEQQRHPDESKASAKVDSFHCMRRSVRIPRRARKMAMRGAITRIDNKSDIEPCGEP